MPICVYKHCMTFRPQIEFIHAYKPCLSFTITLFAHRVHQLSFEISLTWLIEMCKWTNVLNQCELTSFYLQFFGFNQNALWFASSVLVYPTQQCVGGELWHFWCQRHTKIRPPTSRIFHWLGTQLMCQILIQTVLH